MSGFIRSTQQHDHISTSTLAQAQAPENGTILFRTISSCLEQFRCCVARVNRDNASMSKSTGNNNIFLSHNSFFVCHHIHVGFICELGGGGGVLLKKEVNREGGGGAH